MNDPILLERRKNLIWNLYLDGNSLQEISEVVTAVTKQPVSKTRIFAIVKGLKKKYESNIVIEGEEV